jgi:hypothetical protein
MVKELEEITPPHTEEPQDILYAEVQAAIQALKRNKSPGLDGIMSEMLQVRGEQLARQIHKHCKKACHEGKMHAAQIYSQIFLFAFLYIIR